MAAGHESITSTLIFELNVGDFIQKSKNCAFEVCKLWCCDLLIQELLGLGNTDTKNWNGESS